MIAEALVDRPQLVGDAHPHVAVDELRRALGVEGDEVERRARLAGGVVRPAQAVLEEVAQELAAAARGVRPAHPGRGQGAAHGVDGVVVELVELLGRAAASSRCSARSRPPSTSVSTSARPYLSTQCLTHW